MGVVNLLKSRRIHQIQAKAEVNYRTDDKRLVDLSFGQNWRTFGFAREVERPLRIAFPEIDTRPEPIVVVAAGSESCSPSSQNIFTTALSQPWKPSTKPGGRWYRVQRSVSMLIHHRLCAGCLSG